MTAIAPTFAQKSVDSIQSKSAATKISILASALLSALKLLVGLMTGSLGLLAEAAHSFLDLLSTIITFFVIRLASVPPDDNHPYGHEKAEHLGALAGMALLSSTAAFILYHAFEKILFKPEAPHISVWSFVVLIVSLVVDFFRARSLKKSAALHSSQALASDAAHFTNDMLGSLAVIVGLALVALARFVPMPLWLVTRADAIAALAVAAIALHSVWTLGSAAVRSLMDDVPADLVNRLKVRVEGVNGVIRGSVMLRPRFVGSRPYVEVKVGMPRGTSLETAHELSDRVEEVIAEELGSADATVHVEPLATPDESQGAAIRAIAQRLGLPIHNLNIYLVGREYCVELDLEVSDTFTVSEAHKCSEALEHALMRELRQTARVEVHLEPRNDEPLPAVRHLSSMERVKAAIVGLEAFERVVVRDVLLTDEGLVVTLERRFSGSEPLSEAHASMAGLERGLRALIPDVARVRINPEVSQNI
jgi:cation diffusion facilitator family transporter